MIYHYTLFKIIHAGLISLGIGVSPMLPWPKALKVQGDLYNLTAGNTEYPVYAILGLRRFICQTNDGQGNWHNFYVHVNCQGNVVTKLFAQF